MSKVTASGEKYASATLSDRVRIVNEPYRHRLRAWTLIGVDHWRGVGCVRTVPFQFHVDTDYRQRLIEQRLCIVVVFELVFCVVVV